MSDDQRAIELEVEVPGSPGEVWAAIATGPGISSWYVPHTVEERTGGAATASFGAGPGMEVTGRVAAWEPPSRVVFDGGEEVDGMAFEWTVEARDGGTCVVRLVNSGFGSGDDWDAQFDAMTEGWRMFLLNLELHRKHFPGQWATASLPMALWTTSRDQAWADLTGALGLPAAPAVDERVKVSAGEAPALAGTVVETTAHRLSLLVDEPAPGTAFLAAENNREGISVTVWSYLYGAEGSSAVERDEPRWQQWLTDHAPSA